jgi:hypothetical protein
MKLPVQKQRRAAMRLDAVLFVVALLWIVASLLLVILYRPGTAHAVQPRGPAHEFEAQIVTPPADLQPLIYIPTLLK